MGGEKSRGKKMEGRNRRKWDGGGKGLHPYTNGMKFGVEELTFHPNQCNKFSLWGEKSQLPRVV